jgi:hypothetical protein
LWTAMGTTRGREDDLRVECCPLPTRALALCSVKNVRIT